MFERLKQVLRSDYTHLLEEEVARERADNERLRAENRALMNSLLGTAGFPPVEFPEAPKPQPCRACASIPGTSSRPGANPTPGEMLRMQSGRNKKGSSEELP